MIVIGVPTTGEIPVEVVGSIDSVLLTHEGVVPKYVQGSLVYDARSQIMEYALSKNADLLFLDSDIIFPLEAFDRLVAHHTDIVSGLYYGRHEGHTGPIAYKTIRPKTIFRPQELETITEIRPFMEVAGVGLGFCLIRNNVLETVARKVTRINPFEPFGNLGEDLSFFVRLRRLGFKCYLDTTVELKHIGKYGFSAEDYKGA